MPIQFLDPSAGPVATEGALANREPIEGELGVGLLDNGKRNSDRVLDQVAKRLASAFPGARFEQYRKPSAYKPAPEELLGKIAARCRRVITGVGD